MNEELRKLLYRKEELTEFVKKHGKPADPSYYRDPYVADVRAGKNSPLYNAHSYHTKVPPEA